MAVSETKRIARKNERITFQINTVTTDKYGNHKNTWEDYFSCFAYASTFQASEQGDVVLTDERSVIFYVRYCPELSDALSTKYRIILRGDVFDVLSVDMMNYQKDEIRFICRKEKR